MRKLAAMRDAIACEADLIEGMRHAQNAGDAEAVLLFIREIGKAAARVYNASVALTK